MNWFKRKQEDLPDFWITYQKTFLNHSPEDPLLVEYVVLDTETTGFDYVYDRMLCIGALKLKEHTISVQDSLEIYIKQEVYNSDSTPIHGILKNTKKQQYSELAALEIFIKYLGNKVIVAHHSNFDINMINRALKRHQLPNLKNRFIDTAYLYKQVRLHSPQLLEQKDHYSLDELADKFSISKKDRHTALGDAYITAILFLKIINRMKSSSKKFYYYIYFEQTIIET